MFIFLSIRTCSRLLHILAILIKRSIFYLGLLTGLFPGQKYEKGDKKHRINTAHFVRETLEKLGPTFVKLGQFLSIRPDLVPTEVCNEFRSLQDKVPPFPFCQVKEILIKELNKSSVNTSYGLVIAALIIFAAALSNDTVFGQWLGSIIHLSGIPVLPIVSLVLAGYLSVRLFLRNHIQKRIKK